jgi:AcrR family transcriptional regulator
VVDTPVPDPLADLAPTARRIVETTRRLLIEKGYSHLSLENIAHECGINKTAVRYYFHNKAGLMELVVDSWVHDNIGLLAPLLDLPQAETLSVEERVAAFVRAKREMSENTQAYLAFFELLPAMLRDERHSRRIENLYEWAIELYLRLFADSLRGLDEHRARGVAQLVIAVVDGLAVQNVISAERFPADAAYEGFAAALATWMRGREAAAPESDAFV